MHDILLSSFQFLFNAYILVIYEWCLVKKHLPWLWERLEEHVHAANRRFPLEGALYEIPMDMMLMVEL